MNKILTPRFDSRDGKSVCLCGEPNCTEVIAFMADGGLQLPALITEVGIIKGVKRFARDMAQEFTHLDPQLGVRVDESELPIVVVCPASHQENMITPEMMAARA